MISYNLTEKMENSMSFYDEFNNNQYGSQTKVVELVGAGKKVLEIGCASGRISKRLTENGCKVVGVEIDANSSIKAKNFCHEVVTCDIESLEDLDYHDNYFDVILFSNVLEHLKSPLNVLKKLKRYLKSDGYIVVAVPNIANIIIRIKLLMGKFEYEDSGILDRTHLRFFNEKNAKDLLYQAGFNIIKFDIVPFIPVLTINPKIEYKVAKIRPNLFSAEFLIVGKK